MRMFLTASTVTLAHIAIAGDFQPKTYTSSSGKYSLTVDPSDRDGAGKARYVLKSGGEITWSGEEPFTFRGAFVADDGTFGGYGYSKGHSEGASEFVVALIDAKGNIRAADKTLVVASQFLHTAGDPKATGIFLQPENNRFVVRVGDPDLNSNVESWWSYRLGDGSPIGKSRPRDEMDSTQQYIVAAQPVANTPLTLIHWVRLDKKGNRFTPGARFTLVDPGNKPVWTLDLPADYVNPQNERAEADLLTDIQEHGGILNSTQPAHFVIRQVAAGLRVTYVAAPSPLQTGKWDVQETARAAFSTSSAKEPEASSSSTVVEVSLKQLSSIELAGKVPGEGTLPIHDVRSFVPGEAGRFGFLRNCGCENDGKHSLVIVDDSGRLVREIDLPTVKSAKQFGDRLAWLQGNAWVVTTTSYGSDGSPSSSAMRIDAGTGVVTPMTAFVAPSVDALAGFPDGSFVALTKDYKANTVEDTVTVFDEDGKRRWDIHQGNGEGELFSPQAVAFATSGEVVVLENISNKLKIFTKEGRHRTTIDLKDAWGHEPNYPSGLHSDRSGGVLIYDFHGSPALVHMSLTGDVLGAFTPVYGDGRHFDILGDVQSSSTGDLWTSDGHALLRLDTRGIVDRVLGSKPNFDSLGDIGAVAVTSKGWIYASDERTVAVHVFNENGDLQHVCRPEVGDYQGLLRSPSLTVSDSGDVFVTRNDYSGRDSIDFLHYDARGQRVGVEKISLNEVAQSLLSQPGTTNRWVLGYERAYLVDSNAKVLNRLDRAADGNWLETPGPGSVAQDGSIALVSGAHPDPTSRTPPNILITIFSADGHAVVTWPAPSDISTFDGEVAFDGERIAFVLRPRGQEKPAALLITDKRGKALYKAPLPSAHFGARVFFVRSNGAPPQLWVFNGKATIDRFVLP